MRAAALFLAAAVMMGATLPLGRTLRLAGAPALPLLAAAFAIAGLTLLVLTVRREHGQLTAPRTWRFAAVAALLGMTLPHTIAFSALSTLGAAAVALGYALPPAFTYLLARLTGMESGRPVRLAATALALAGGLVLAWPSDTSVESAWLAKTAVLLLLPFSLAAGNLYRKRFMPPRASSALLAGVTLTAAAVELTLTTLASGASFTGPWLTNPAFAALVIATGIGFVFYFAAQKRIDVTLFSQIGNLMAITAALVAWVLLGEAPPLAMAPAVPLIAAGAWLLARYPAHRANANARERRDAYLDPESG
ncbi:DMT family transporter [Arhodomonas sp. AD133]|uniref:DMT family transporter n=1 Tax=Arhodomonas sp. AD133 TaxID=3415009 RepID=UPI003EC004A3